MAKFAIAIHGGAGTIKREQLTPDKEFEYTRALTDALAAGYDLLEKGSSATEAVEAAVIELENNPLFNAGKGSVFSAEGKHEMDAAIMDGSNLQAGAVAAVTSVRNPISLAKAVMEQTKHVMLCGSGAEQLAKEFHLELEDDEYFFTQQRFDQWQKAKEAGEVVLDHSDEKKFGTVGAVALDVEGNLAAGTSTGGMTNKRYGRVGDSPLIGGGTYASDICAVSCTGDGEFFIRSVAAHSLASMMKYGGKSLIEACEQLVQKDLVEMGGEGGLIAVDGEGNIALPFNSEGMYRASRRQGEELVVKIFRD